MAQEEGEERRGTERKGAALNSVLLLAAVVLWKMSIPRVPC